MLGEVKPSPGLKNQRLTTRSSPGNIQKNMLATRMAIRNAIIRRSDFARDETGLDGGALIAAAHALANLQKTCRFDPCKVLDEAAEIEQRTSWSHWLACGDPSPP
uniref:Uncharacterized protein n=1 Tax=Aurantimonas manganoxydans TaxID=651183 RepID=A0A0P0Z4Z8_9HYPH|nr:hypothetical protein [Aurantimonas manganoxydans SI85-9A1]